MPHDVKERFIRHWGEMGTRWGVSREVASMHALMYLSAVPLGVDDIAQALGMNAAAVVEGINELKSWGLAYTASGQSGSAQKYQAERDVWTMLQIIADQRKRKELDPTITVLGGFVEELKDAQAGEDAEMKNKIAELLEFLQDVSALYERGRKLPTALIKKVISLDKTLEKLLSYI